MHTQSQNYFVLLLAQFAFSVRYRIALFVVALAASVSLVAQPSYAGSIYLSHANAEIRLLGYTDLLGNPINSGVSFYGTVTPSATNSSTHTGNAFAANPGTAIIDAADPLDLQIGEGVLLDVMATGFSDSPFGIAESNNQTDGNLRIINNTSDPVIAHFAFSYGWAIAKSITDGLVDSVTAGYRFNFHTHGATLSESLETTRLLDVPAGIFSDTITFSGTFPVGERGVHIIAEALGTAHTVPEPSSIVLLLMGCTIAGGAALRKKLRRLPA